MRMLFFLEGPEGVKWESGFAPGFTHFSLENGI